MMITRGKFLSRGDIWFDEKPEKLPNVDVLYYYSQPTPPPIPEIEFDEEDTLLIDLTKDSDELLRNIKKKDRYKIRQAAQKDRVTYNFWESIDAEILNKFYDFYQQFTSQQGLRSLSNLEQARLDSYIAAKALAISQVESLEGKPLSWRVYYYSKERVFPLHSALIRASKDASENQMLGRANRYHRWQDILKFKSLGVLTYDLGGLYTNPTSQHLLNINKFKDEFGGERVRQFNWRYGITIKGKLFLLLRKMLISSPK